MPAFSSSQVKGAVAGLAAVLGAAALAVSTIAPHEGVIDTAYRDPVGIPTSCAGHTGPEVSLGQRFTLQQCMDQLAADAVKHGLEIDRCIKRPIPLESRAAFTSFAFNVGSGAFCKSTALRKLNAGDLRGACAELSRWTKAGGRELPGLVRRRADERRLCERGLT